MNILNTLKEAITGQPVDPIRDGFEHGVAVGPVLDFSHDNVPPELIPGNRKRWRATHGLSKEIRRAVGAGLMDSERRKSLKDLAGQFRRVFATFTTDAKSNPQQDHAEYLEQLGRQMVAGESLTEPIKSLEYFKGKRESTLAGHRAALSSIYREADGIMRDLYPAAAERAEALFDQELAAERERFAAYGLPLTEPSELLKSLWEAVRFYRDLAKTAPLGAHCGFPPPEQWAHGLVPDL